MPENAETRMPRIEAARREADDAHDAGHLSDAAHEAIIEALTAVLAAESRWANANARLDVEGPDPMLAGARNALAGVLATFDHRY